MECMMNGLLAPVFEYDSTIVHELLKEQEICAQFVPNKLTDNQKQNLEISLKDVPGYKSWCYQYNPETKRQLMEWCSLLSCLPKKVAWQNSRLRWCWSPSLRAIMNFYLRVKLSMQNFTRKFSNICCNLSGGLTRSGPEWTVEFPPWQLRSMWATFLLNTRWLFFKTLLIFQIWHQQTSFCFHTLN